jgi:hypothetical protein
MRHQALSLVHLLSGPLVQRLRLRLVRALSLARLPLLERARPLVPRPPRARVPVVAARLRAQAQQPVRRPRPGRPVRQALERVRAASERTTQLRS